MAPVKPVFTPETFLFFRDLGKNNKKVWMDAHRDRYQAAVAQPFRRLLEKLAPAVLALDDRFDTTGRAGANFSRINRDIRFAKDKTLYKTQMYLKFQQPLPGDRESGQLYAGLSTDMVTAGFRLYGGPKRKESTFALIAGPRIVAKPRWVGDQKRRLGRKYDSYWYTTEKGNWTKHDGWPTRAEDWKKIQAWIVRCKMKPAEATKPGFPKELAKIFREVYPLLKFTSIP
ncbi:MAG TPA: DUF2461 family protein [Candidatus Sulfotelmatobacter sp.]|jgi:uncharacterized protein (TIGR02453 family)|nr:DUF2461 family protein [Candidatus Sulfotelmatobacter sp.]